MKRLNLAKYVVPIVIVAILFFVLINSSFVNINSGETGVLFKRLGGGLDKDNVYGQGLQFVLPWNDMIVYDVREKLTEEGMDVRSKDGLDIEMDVAVLYSPDQNKIGYLHDEIGPNYERVVVRNAVRSAARNAVGKFTPEELYSTKRDSIESMIETDVRTILEDKYLELYSIDIRSVKLPALYTQAIQEKLVQEQEELKYEFRIAKERKEAERKEIEAEGIKAFQDIVSDGISTNYLKWKGIEATESLAASDNTKVIVIGGSDGLPLILNGN